MAKNNKLVLLRLQKEESKLSSEPIEQAWVAREGVLNFHFCIHSLDGAYEGGFYHGVLQLSDQYPFAPPKLLFFTPSGRFEINKPICTTFTNYHKQSWTSSWNVRTMILATISFMNSEEPGAGYVSSSFSAKRKYARDSMAFNLNNPLFRQLFKKELAKQQKQSTGVREATVSPREKGEQRETQQVLSPSYGIYGLYMLLVVILVIWFVVKNS